MAHQWQDSCNARTVDEHVGTRVILLALACVPAKRDRALQRSATALPDYTAKRSPHDISFLHRAVIAQSLVRLIGLAVGDAVCSSLS